MLTPMYHTSIAWRLGTAVALFTTWTSHSTLSPANTGTGDHLWAVIPPRYVTIPTSTTQPCIPQWSLNWVPGLTGLGEGGNVTSAGWQLTLCNPHTALSSSRSAEPSCITHHELMFLFTRLEAPVTKLARRVNELEFNFLQRTTTRLSQQRLGHSTQQAHSPSVCWVINQLLTAVD